MNKTFSKFFIRFLMVMLVLSTLSLVLTLKFQPVKAAISTPYVWVTNWGDDTVSKIDSSNGSVSGPYNVGTSPNGLAVDASGNVWVANYGEDTVTKLNGATGATIGTYAVGDGPDGASGVAVDASGNVWVTNYNADTVTKFNGATGATINIYNVGASPEGVAVDGSGNIWVVNYGDGTVTKLNGTTGAVIGTYNVGTEPEGVAIDGDNNAWVANYADDTVTKINGATGAIIGTYAVGNGPWSIAVDGSGNVWVTNSEAGTVSKLNGTTGVAIGTYSVIVGESLQSVAVDGDGNIWVASIGHIAGIYNDTMNKLNGATGAIMGSYNVGWMPGYFGDMTGFALHRFVLGEVEPDAPSGVTSDTPTTSGFTINWTDNSSNETGFKVYISTSPTSGLPTPCDATATYTLYATTASDATSQVVTSQSANSQYCAKVVATNTFGDSTDVYAAAPQSTLDDAIQGSSSVKHHTDPVEISSQSVDLVTTQNIIELPQTGADL